MEREIINYKEENLTGKCFAFTDENMKKVADEAEAFLNALSEKQFYLRCEIRRAGYVQDAIESDEVSKMSDRLHDLLDVVKHGGRYVEDWGWSKVAKWNYIDQTLADAEFLTK